MLTVETLSKHCRKRCRDCRNNCRVLSYDSGLDSAVEAVENCRNCRNTVEKLSSTVEPGLNAKNELQKTLFASTE